MNILMLSTDRAMFEEGSSVRERIKEQATVASTLHVIVLTLRNEKFFTTHIGKHVTVYPTLSSSRFAYIIDAYRIGKDILKNELKNKKWLVTAQDPFEIGAIGYLLSRKFQIPIHLQVHTDPWSQWWKKSGILNRIRFMLATYLLRHANGVRVVSERVRLRVIELGVPPLRITKIPIFVDIKHFVDAAPAFDLHRSYPGFSQIILSIGRLQPEKNFRGLIRAFSEVRKNHDGALLIIVGNGPERERLFLLARSFGLEHCVKILPWARDVATYYKTSDIYVQPSFYEGWGLAVVEALASGCPVIMTDVGCAGEVVKNEEGGLVVPVDNEKVLVHAMLRLLDNHAFALSLAAGGNVAVKKLATKAETTMLYKSSWENAFVTKNK